MKEFSDYFSVLACFAATLLLFLSWILWNRYRQSIKRGPPRRKKAGGPSDQGYSG
jgi:hypothetical protein